MRARGPGISTGSIPLSTVLPRCTPFQPTYRSLDRAYISNNNNYLLQLYINNARRIIVVTISSSCNSSNCICCCSRISSCSLSCSLSQRTNCKEQLKREATENDGTRK